MNLLSRSSFLTLAIVLAAAAPAPAAESSNRDHPVQVITRAAPVYPYLMRHAGTAAEVTVLFTVTSTGVVTHAKVINSTNFEFNASILDAIKKWTFTPASRNGQAIDAKVQQTFTFSVRDDSKTGDAGRIAGFGAR
jgi:TonB family protein